MIRGIINRVASAVRGGGQAKKTPQQVLDEAGDELLRTAKTGKQVVDSNAMSKLRMDPATLISTHTPAELRALAGLALHGYGGHQNLTQAIGLYAFAASEGDVEAAYSLAQCIRNGIGPTPEIFGEKREEVALELLETIVEQVQHPWAMFGVATMRLQQLQAEMEAIIESEQRGSVQLRTIEDEAERERAVGKLERRVARQRQRLLTDARAKRIFGLMTKSAAAGVPPANIAVANCYFDGVGVETGPSEEKGMAWLKRAASLGDPIALTNLASRVGGDAADAASQRLSFEFYLQAAQAGRPIAMYNVGVAYLEGRDAAEAGGQPVEKEPARAADWFGKALDGGFGLAGVNLAIQYAEGIGVPQSLEKSLEVLDRAEAAGAPEEAVSAHRGYVRARLELSSGGAVHLDPSTLEQLAAGAAAGASAGSGVATEDLGAASAAAAASASASAAVTGLDAADPAAAAGGEQAAGRGAQLDIKLDVLQPERQGELQAAMAGLETASSSEILAVLREFERKGVIRLGESVVTHAEQDK